ncbi:MAG TPA: hypothetical protein VIL11_02360 [Limnochordales bacterium]
MRVLLLLWAVWALWELAHRWDRLHPLRAGRGAASTDSPDDGTYLDWELLRRRQGAGRFQQAAGPGLPVEVPGAVVTRR